MDYDEIVRLTDPLTVYSLTLYQMVLDTGQIVEFASPNTLLSDKNGVFRAMVENSEERAELYALAGFEVE